MPYGPPRAGFAVPVVLLGFAQIDNVAHAYNSAKKNNGTDEVHNEETFRTLEASLEALKQIIYDQRTVIGAVQHERDLLAAGYVEALKECEELKALLKASNDADTSSSSHG